MSAGLRDPYFICGSTAQADNFSLDGQRERPVIIASVDFQRCAWTKSPLLQKLQQFAITLVNALHRVVISRMGFRQQQQAAFALTLGVFGGSRIAVRARTAAAELARERYSTKGARIVATILHL